MRVWWAGAGIAAALFSVVVVGAVAATGLPLWIALPLVVIAVALAGLLPVVIYRRWRYEIRTRDLFFSRGALFFVHTLVPFDRIQFVETRQGPLDRIVGLTRLAVYTAAGRAAEIPGLRIPEAEELREQLSKVAGTESV